ncbi:MAG: polysaccharide deacetylase family protein [Clostridia bacterium]|nr:polysaccharide deacetylase family protein [Clostridia bacterium]
MKFKKTVAFALALMLSLAVVIFSAGMMSSGTKYNDVNYRSYINLSENSDIPSLFRNDSVFPSYKKYPPVIMDGIEYVPLELFYGLSNVKISYSKDATNFYIQNKKNNKYISFSISDGYAVTNNNNVVVAAVQSCYGIHYVPLRTVCSSIGLGCDSYNDGVNKVYAIKIYNTSGLSAKELVAIHAPEIYAVEEEKPTESSGETQPSGNQSVQIPTGSGQQSNNPPAPVTPPKQEEKPVEVLHKSGTIMLFYPSFDGERAGATLDTLSAKGLKATFFVTEKNILDFPAIIRRMYVEGHTIGITFAESPDELYAEGALEEKTASTENALYEIIKTKTRIAYLPKMSDEASAEINARAEALGLCTVQFNGDSRTDTLRTSSATARMTESLKDIPASYGSSVAYIKMSFTDSGNAVLGVIANHIRLYPQLKSALFDETTK